MMRRDRLPRSNRLRPSFAPLEARALLSGGLAPTSPSALHADAASQQGVAYNPQQIRHAYGVDQLPQDGTGQTIAIIDPYNDTNIGSDLSFFDSHYSLPVANLVVDYYQNGALTTGTAPAGMETTDAAGAAFSYETSLDVEWAHAMAPGATILLVQTYANNATDLINAAAYVGRNNLANQVTMSFAFGGDSPTVSQIDGDLMNMSTSFFAASGDNGTTANNGSTVNTPAESDYVVSVGGTTLTLDQSNNVQSETGWANSGGGTSASSSSRYYEARPQFQDGFQTSNGRDVPDVSYDADPNTAFAIICTLPTTNSSGGTSDTQYYTSASGTSAGAPQWAALAALVNQGRAANNLQPIGTGLTYGLNSALYTLAGRTSYTNPNGDFRDITTGNNGTPAMAGYDTVTGLGSPIANKLVPDLIAYGASGTIAPTVADAGFSNPVNPQGNSAGGSPSGYTYNPTSAYYPAGVYWQFGGQSGVSHDGTAFTAGSSTSQPGSPGELQVAFVQQQGMISETVANFAAGTYKLSFLAAQRGNNGTSNETLQVLVDNAVVDTITPSNTSYLAYSTSPFSVGAGSHTIAFRGVNSTGDNTAFLDNVSLAPASATNARSQARTASTPASTSDAIAPVVLSSGPASVAVPAVAGLGSASPFPVGPLGSQFAPIRRPGMAARWVGDSLLANYRPTLVATQATGKGIASDLG